MVDVLLQSIEYCYNTLPVEAAVVVEASFNDTRCDDGEELCVKMTLFSSFVLSVKVWVV